MVFVLEKRCIQVAVHCLSWHLYTVVPVLWFNENKYEKPNYLSDHNVGYLPSLKEGVVRVKLYSTSSVHEAEIGQLL